MHMDINHSGPFLAHLSKVPEGQDVSTYDGSGDWIKIHTLGLERWESETEPFHWLAWNQPLQWNGNNQNVLPGRVSRAPSPF